MVEFRDVAGMALDLGISFGISKLAVGKGLGKEIAADVLGSGLGGAVGAGVSSGASLNSITEGALAGAGFGALGSAAGIGLSKGLGKFGKADGAYTEARNVHSRAVEDANALDRADDAVEAAGEQLKGAQDALTGAQARRATADQQLQRAEADLARIDPATSPDAYARMTDRVDAARRELTAADSAVADAQKALDEAGENTDKALDEYRKADAAASALEDTADAAMAAELAAKRKAAWWGEKGHVAKYGHPSLVALGSGIGTATAIDWSDGGGGPGGGGSVPLVWDGQAAAAAGGVAGKAPFERTQTNPGVIVTGGQGFLLRPEELSPELITAFNGATGSFAATVVDVYQMSGDLEKKIELRLDPAPRMPQGITVGSSSGGDSYEQATAKVDSALDDLYESDVSNKARAEKIEEISATVKESVGFLIAGANTQVQQLTASPELEINFMSIVSQGFDELIGILEAAASAMERVASGIEDPGAGDDDASRRLDDRVKQLENSMKDPSLVPDGSGIGLKDPGQIGGLGVGTPEVPGTASADLADAAKQMEDRANDALQATGPPGSTDPGSLGGMVDPAAAANMAGDNPMDAMSRMMMMSQLMGRNGADSDLARRVDDIDPARYDAAAPPNMPVARPAATTPWSTQPAAPQTPAQPVNHQSAPPTGATSNQTGSGMPKRVPGADGLVVYPLPDGRTQKITLTRALGLDKGFANKSGTDAQAAYAKTPAEWTNHKNIGAAVDPFELSTGDVATWRRVAKDGEKVPAGVDAVVGTAIAGPAKDDENSPVNGPEKSEGRQSGDSGGEPEYRTAVLVVFGDGESGTVEAIVQGELQPFDPEMADADGAMGEFAGFKRPNGLEDSGADGQDTDTAMNTDQPAMDMPALAGPA